MVWPWVQLAGTSTPGMTDVCLESFHLWTIFLKAEQWTPNSLKLAVQLLPDQCAASSTIIVDAFPPWHCVNTQLKVLDQRTAKMNQVCLISSTWILFISQFYLSSTRLISWKTKKKKLLLQIAYLSLHLFDLKVPPPMTAHIKIVNSFWQLWKTEIMWLVNNECYQNPDSAMVYESKKWKWYGYSILCIMYFKAIKQYISMHKSFQEMPGRIKPHSTHITGSMLVLNWPRPELQQMTMSRFALCFSTCALAQRAALLTGWWTVMALPFPGGVRWRTLLHALMLV